MGKVNLKNILQNMEEWLRQMWPPLFAWLIGVVLSFLPLGSKQLIYRMLGVSIEGIFHDIEVLYICVTASAVFICYVMQEKFERGNKFLIIMDMVFIIIGAMVYASCKCGELISQKWPFIEIHEIDQIWPGFIKIFFVVVSAINIVFYALLPGINLPVQSKSRS